MMKTLTKTKAFRRNGPNGVQVLVLQPGERYRYERSETETTVVHTATVLRDGFTWTCVETTTKKAAAAAKSYQPAYAIPEAATQVGDYAAAAINKTATRQTRNFDDFEREVRRLDRAVKLYAGKVYEVSYYIPTSQAKEIPSPADIFHEHGVWGDGSHWFFTEEGLNHPDVQEVFAFWNRKRQEAKGTPSTLGGAFVRRRRMRYWITELTREQFQAKKEETQDQLAEALMDAHERLLARIDAAAEDLRKALDKLPPEGEGDDAEEAARRKAMNNSNGRLRSAVSAAAADFQMVLRGAEMFDDTGSLDALSAAYREALRVQTVAVNSLLRSRGAKGVTLPPNVA